MVHTLSDLPKARLEVRFFQAGNGREPVRDWLRELAPEDRKSIGASILEVQAGWPIGMPLVRKMELRLWEVLVHLKDRVARIMFTLSGNTVILLHGFIKKTQATAGADLRLARRRCKEVFRD